MLSKDVLLSLMALGQKQQGSPSVAMRENKLFPEWAPMSKASQSSRIRQIISVAYVSANSDLSNTG